MGPDGAWWRRVLTAAAGFAGVHGPEPELVILHAWLDGAIEPATTERCPDAGERDVRVLRSRLHAAHDMLDDMTARLAFVCRELEATRAKVPRRGPSTA